MDTSTQPSVETKRQKVRAAWISFAGRIAAQLIGAVATVGLGVVVLGGRVPPAAASVAPASSEQSVLVAKPVRTQHGTVIVLVPLDRYHDLTAETVEKVSQVVATDLSQTAGGTNAQAEMPVWAAANAH